MHIEIHFKNTFITDTFYLTIEKGYYLNVFGILSIFEQ